MRPAAAKYPYRTDSRNPRDRPMTEKPRAAGQTTETRAAASPNSRQKVEAVGKQHSGPTAETTGSGPTAKNVGSGPTTGTRRQQASNNKQRTGTAGKQCGGPTAGTRTAAVPNSRRKGRNRRETARQTDSRNSRHRTDDHKPRDGQPRTIGKGPETPESSAATNPNSRQRTDDRKPRDGNPEQPAKGLKSSGNNTADRQPKQRGSGQIPCRAIAAGCSGRMQKRGGSRKGAARNRYIKLNSDIRMHAASYCIRIRSSFTVRDCRIQVSAASHCASATGAPAQHSACVIRSVLIRRR